MVSVIICTYNRERYIFQALKCLAEQSLAPKDFEIVIVNNKSTDNTGAIAKKFVDENPRLQVRYIEEHSQGLSFARNRGISESHGDLIVFIDDDAFAKRDFLAGIKSFFEKHPDASAIGGKIVPEFESCRPDWMSDYLLPLVAAIDLGEGVIEFPKNKFPLGANMSFRRNLFQKYGTFNTELGRKGNNLLGSEEKDLFMRLKKDGLKIYYFPEASVRHIIPDSRLSMEYIRKQAIGVGQSERTRVKTEGGVFAKIIDESVKAGGTVILSLGYLLSFQPAKAFMLLRFRCWVIKGFLS
jgi:glucosyl-dolichyl phosphate glucuronosyltransferase